MNPLIADNFAPDLAAVRKAVIDGPFVTREGPDGGTYTGISTYPVDHWFERVSHIAGCKITPKLSCFRLNLKGELPHSWVHSDEICADFASVLYLNLPDQCKGGTAFWKHVPSGMGRLLFNQTPEFYAQMTKDWKDLSLWRQTSLVPMRWNRFVTYPTSWFHSRWPHEAFGSSPEDGRLIWICFYDRTKCQ
jgi:Family of unknown function (DUF6445)